MDFSALKTELAARGFDSLSTTRQGQYVNWARAELDESYLWPYRETSQTGAAPLTVTDLGVIESVVNSNGSPLTESTRSAVLEQYGSLTTAGTAESWYITGGTAVAVYPVSTVSITVRHFKVPADLSASGDTPLAPARWHRLIVDIAVRMAYRDSDNHGEAEALGAQIERDKALMADALLSGSDFVSPVGDDN